MPPTKPEKPQPSQINVEELLANIILSFDGCGLKVTSERDVRANLSDSMRRAGRQCMALPLVIAVNHHQELVEVLRSVVAQDGVMTSESFARARAVLAQVKPPK